MRELKIRGFLALSVALTLLIVPAQVASQTPATIRMVYWPGPESDAMRKVVDWYNANRSAADGVKVEMVLFSREGFFDKEATVLAARSPEVDMVFTASYILGRHAPHMDSLEKVVAASGEGSLQVFLPSARDSLSFQGRPYAVPMDVSNHFLYYRSDYLNRLLTDSAWQRRYSEVAQRELGKALSPKKPEDWSPDDFVAAALFFTKTINPDSPTAFGTVLQAKNLIYNVMIWDNFLYGLGGSWFRSGFQPALNTPQAQKALDVYVTIMQKKATPAGSTSYEYGEANEAFRTGKVAFMVQWSAAFHELDDKTKSPMVAGNVKLAPVPGKKTHVHALGVGISAYSNTKPAVQKWVRFLATTQAMRMYADAGGIPPVRAALANPALAKQRPEFPLIAEHVEKYGYVETTIAETVPILEILAKHLSAAWALQVAPKIALDQANGEITQLLKEKGYLK